MIFFGKSTRTDASNASSDSNARESNCLTSFAFISFFVGLSLFKFAYDNKQESEGGQTVLLVSSGATCMFLSAVCVKIACTQHHMTLVSEVPPNANDLELGSDANAPKP